MLRSEINAHIAHAQALFARHDIKLPPWGHWSADDWAAAPDLAAWCRDHQMGWDITDFNGGDFGRRGLVLFCLRNGKLRVPGEVPYAEKIMVVEEEQETPLHFHKVKMEDIIVRGGGNLVVEMYNTDAEGARRTDPVMVRTDGIPRQVDAGAKLVLSPGESITVPRNLYHRFYGEKGSGTVVVGEVSQVNDDLTDNYFYDAPARFSEIVEDCAPTHLLWNELPTAR